MGKQLFIRSNRKITLTEKGMILRKRAVKIREIVKKTGNEIPLSDETITGGIAVRTGETDGVRFLARTTEKFTL